ncbi:putative E3 ubiquitin-protein ligase [Trichinella spiralis]|uniref:E3 ubiquitin-protein ligase n=1 Tax=Trichinella spiralis TaxID=6334 RepID=A0ABR3KW67_TRISP
MQTRPEPIDIQMSNLSLKSTHKRLPCSNNDNNNHASNTCFLNVESSARSDRISYKNQQEIKEKLHQIRTLMKEKQDKLQMAMSKSYHS